ncbi:MAG: T9SS type A sorting domain-containing protein [Flavobacteriales bacterium]
MRYLLFALIITSIPVFAQQGEVKVTKIKVTDSWRVNTNDFNPADATIRQVQAPFPGGEGEKAQLIRLKERSAELYPKKVSSLPDIWSAIRADKDSLTIADSFPARFFLNDANLQGGTPNDNTLAISNAGHLLVSWNTQLWGYDMVNDSFLFKSTNPHPSLLAFISGYTESGLVLNDAFDPKLYYDPHADRFFMMFLSGRDSINSSSIIAFSETNYPSGNWYAYRLTGNPLNDGTWTDYPQVAFNNHSMYLTLNQLNGGDWVTDFDQTVIWQIDLDGAYAGAQTLDTKVISDIEYGGKKLRYLRPVKTANGPSDDDMFFISNRPRALSNDSVWLVRVTGTIDDPTGTEITLLKSDVNYGIPPYADQAGNQTFWTNDARALGAVRVQNEIQFVGNSIDHNNGNASIYHGVIADAYNPTLSARIISDPVKEFGFPNIEFVGTNLNARDFVINFNHTSETDFAGNSAILYNSERVYGPLQTLKKGSTYVNMLGGNDERWGDYIGLQRKFNELNTVWAAGYFSYGSQRAGTWISELKYPIEIDSTSDGSGSTIYIVNGDSFVLIHGNYYPLGTQEVVKSKPRIFPNPTLDYITFEFDNPQTSRLNVDVYDVNGRLHSSLLNTTVIEGKNELRFNISHFSSGVYYVVIKSNDNILLKEKFVKD